MTTQNDIEQLFKTHYADMHRMAMLILRDEDVARDIVHDVFANLLDRQRRASEGDSFAASPSGSWISASGAYLLKSVRNRCLNYLSGMSVKERMTELYALDMTEIADEDWPDDDTIALIHATVANDLSEACKRVVNLRFAEGKSYKEIARKLSISEVAVYKHLRHAMDILRSKFSKNG